jgi:hypothetical protein
MSEMTTAIQADLRLLVREVLREVLPTSIKNMSAGKAPMETVAMAPAAGEFVSLKTEADLDLFVKRLARLCEEPIKRTELAEGVLRFRLTPIVSEIAPIESRKVIRIERGAVTERHVKQASEQGAVLVLNRTAVLTPLGRDRARALGVEVEREK